MTPLEASSVYNPERAFPISVLAVAGAPKYPGLLYFRRKKVKVYAKKLTVIRITNAGGDVPRKSPFYFLLSLEYIIEMYLAGVVRLTEEFKKRWKK